MVDGRIGRALAAIRENDLSAITFGVSVRQYKVAMFGISAAVTAVAGSMFMIQNPYATDTKIAPTDRETPGHGPFSRPARRPPPGHRD